MTLPKKLLFQGAEAIILLSKDVITKDRIPKTYRLPELDNKIRKRRTKSETKLLLKASKIINSPAPLNNLDGGRLGLRGGAKNNFQIFMPFINGKKLSEHLDNFPLTKQKSICKQIGESIAQLHDADIIHGDLTTSNMILVEHKNTILQINKLTNKKSKSSSLINKGGGGVEVDKNNPKIFFIDFGLGFISHKYEDKAVDLHLLKQAFEAKHFKNWETLVEEVLNGYKKTENAKIILERLKAVEKRGRYKH